MPTNGDWLVPWINGDDFTGDFIGASGVSDKNDTNELPNQNLGVVQYNAGPYNPAAALDVFRKRSQVFQPTFFDRLMTVSKGAVGSAADQELIMTLMFGINASPAVGDWGFLMDATTLTFQDKPAPGDNLKAKVTTVPRGLRGGFGRLLMNQTTSVTGTITSAFLDRGTAASAGTLKGLVAHLHCFTPSALYASGTVTMAGTIPTDGDTVTLLGQVYTFKTTLTPTAGQVLIGATPTATGLNLWQALVGAKLNAGVSYATGTVPLAATVYVAKPASTVLTIQAVTPGTAGNAFTLASAGGANKPTVSGATLAGGTAGDSYVVTLQSSTTSGGAYTVFGTFTSTLQTQGGERLEIAAGVTINEFIKGVATTGGSTSTPKFAISICPYWQ